MPKKRKKQNISPSEVNDPSIGYELPIISDHSEMKIEISSFEEQEESMRRHWASLTPLERLRDLNLLIRISYGLTPEKLKHPKLKKTIKINFPDDDIF